MTLVPTFVSFTPWITAEGYVEMLATIDNLGLVYHVSPIQYAIRLLIPAGSHLLSMPQVQNLVGEYDQAALAYTWTHPEPRMDDLYQEVFRLARANQLSGETRRIHFGRVWQATAALMDPAELPERQELEGEFAVPVMSEDWY